MDYINSKIYEFLYDNNIINKSRVIHQLKMRRIHVVLTFKYKNVRQYKKMDDSILSVRIHKRKTFLSMKSLN